MATGAPLAHPKAPTPVPGHAQGSAPTTAPRPEGRLSLTRAWKVSTLWKDPFWAQNKKGSSGRNTGDLGDPKPTGVFLFLISCLELERLERGVLNFIPTIPGSGREHQEELLCPEQLCTDPTAWHGQARVGDAAGVPRGDVERNTLYE